MDNFLKEAQIIEKINNIQQAILFIEKYNNDIKDF